MDFDFDSWNANIDKIQSYKLGTRQWDKRIRDEMDDPVKYPRYDLLDELRKKEEQKKKDDPFCFITTACVISRGLNDNCKELMTMRRFRDEYVNKNSQGRIVIRKYYDLAPKIVTAINNNKFQKEIYNSIYEKMLLPIITLINNNEIDSAYFMGLKYFNNLQSTFLQE